MNKIVIDNFGNQEYNILMVPVIKFLSPKDINLLKKKGLLLPNETAFCDDISGDVVAENILTKTRRIIECSGIILESTKKILLG